MSPKMADPPTDWTLKQSSRSPEGAIGPLKEQFALMATIAENRSPAFPDRRGCSREGEYLHFQVDPRLWQILEGKPKGMTAEIEEGIRRSWSLSAGRDVPN